MIKVYNKTFPGRVAGCGRFHNTLQQALVKKPGIWLTNNPEEAEIILFPAAYISGTNMTRWKAGGKKFVHRVDGLFSREGRANLEESMLIVNQLSNITVFQSEYNRGVMMAVGYRDGPVIHNGIDLEYINSVSGLPKDKVFTVMAACRSAAGFKQTQQINILADVPGIRVVFAGRNFRYSDRIKYLGDLDFRQLLVAMKGADLFFHPAINDSCPNVVLEAMACGLPVLHSGTGGTAEIIDGFGYIMSGNYRRDIEYIRTNMFKPSVILGWVRQFDINLIADSYVNVFRRL